MDKSSPITAAIWMSGALLSFVLMAVGARELSSDLHTYQLLAVRSVIGLVILLIIGFAFRLPFELKTPAWPTHIVRNIFHFMGQYGWFLGLGLLPLGEVFALEFTVPFWTAILAATFIGESLNKRTLTSILLGFVGVLIIVKPGSALFQPAAFWVLAAALCYSVAYICTKKLSATTTPFSILFFMCLVQMPIAWALAIPVWTSPNLIQWVWLWLIGITALTAHYCITRAMQRAEASLVVTLDFLRLPLIILVGAILYNEDLSWSLLMGSILMILGNFILLRPLQK